MMSQQTTCPSCDDLSAFNVGKLAVEQREAIRQHVESCATCFSTLQVLDDTGDLLVGELRKSVPFEPFPDPLYERLVAGLQGSEEWTPAASAADLTEPRQLGDYRLIEKLGRGGMGSVYKAMQTRLGKFVAVKLLGQELVGSPELVARFRREAAAIGGLDHPNLVRALDAREEDGVQLLVMEYLEGLDFSKLVRERGPLPVADACEVIRLAASGLHYAHGKCQLVHRDLKPSNLFLTREGYVKVLDLGLARMDWSDASKANLVLTISDQIMGTMDYMAPEQWLDSHSVDLRADIYSLGCTLYFLLTGSPPFAGYAYSSTTQKMDAHLRQSIPEMWSFREDVPGELVPVLSKMLAKSPGDRFADHDAVAAALAPFTQGHNLANLFESKGDLTPSPASARPRKEYRARVIPADTKPLSGSSRRRKLVGSLAIWFGAFLLLTLIWSLVFALISSQ